MVLTIGSFFLWRSHRRLTKQIWELTQQLQLQRQQDFRSEQELLAKSPRSPVQKEAKQTHVSTDEDVVHKKEQSEQMPAEATTRQEQASKEFKPVHTQSEEKEKLVQKRDEPSLSSYIWKNMLVYVQKWIKQRRTKIDWELLIGGRWLNRIGALAIILGLIFFIKYAFDHQLINNQMKVATVVLIGFCFLWAGRYFYRKQLPVFAQGLIGAGVATLYLAVYAAYNFYHLINSTFAFILMSLVTIFAFLQALVYNALAVSLLGWCGGYLTPFFVSVNQANALGLFSYLAFLSFGMILVAWIKRNWSILYHLTLLATYMIFFLYLLVQPVPSQWLLRIGFLLIFWAIFYGYELYYLIRQNQWPIAQLSMASLHAFFLFGGLVWLLKPNHSDWVMESLLLAGIAYLLPLLILFWRRKLSQAVTWQVIRHGITFCLFFNLAPIYHWDRFELVLVWLVQAVFFIFWAHHRRLQWLTFYTLGFLSIVSLVLITQSFRADHHLPFLNLECLSYLGLTIVFLYGAISQSLSTIIKRIYHVSWSTACLIGFSIELSTIKEYIYRITNEAYYRELTFLYGMILFASWIVYSLVLTRIGLWKKIRTLVVTSWCICALGTIYLAIVALTGELEIFPVVFWSRFSIFVIAIIALYLHYRWQRNQHATVALACLYGAVVLGFELITLQIHDYFRFQSIEIPFYSDDRQSLQFTKWAVMWMAWILYSLLLVWYGWRRKIKSFIHLSTILYTLCVLGVFVQGLQYQAISQFVPVFNSRCLMIVVSALVSYGFYLCFLKKGQEKRVVFVFILLLLLFEGVQVEVNDYFQHRMLLVGATQIPAAESVEFTYLLSLAALWIVFSLPFMWIGLRNCQQWIIWFAWIVLGIGLFLMLLHGLVFMPIDYFTPIFNIRSLFFIIAVLVLLVQLAWSDKRAIVQFTGWSMVTILLFILITVEINDLFRLLMQQDQRALYELRNLKQLSFSFAWIFYAILIVIVGLWRKIATLRWGAIGLFGISICKIFVYDLAFLETLYRIILFIGLGIVLLLVSYVYQRYKHLFMIGSDQERSSKN